MIGTGSTMYESILSIDAYGNPVSGATFNMVFYKDGLEYSGVTSNLFISDYQRGVYSLEWSTSVPGNYQFYLKNNTTDVVYMSDKVLISPDEDLGVNVYVGI